MLFDTILSIIEYLIFTTLVLLAAFVAYRGTSTVNERDKHRTKLQKQIFNQRSKYLDKIQSSKLDKQLKLAGNPLGLTAAKFEIFRWIILVVLFFNYAFLPIIDGSFTNKMLIVPVIIYFCTVTTLKYSPGSLAIDYLIKRANKKRIIELFTLFDTLKTELKTLSPNQQVNVYAILKDSVSMFDYIDVPVNKFLSLWKGDPFQAKEVFSTMIGGDSAHALGEIFFRLDRTGKEDALAIIDAESEVFSNHYFETLLQTSSKKKTVSFVCFAGSTVLVIVWFLNIVLSMTTDSIGSTGL